MNKALKNILERNSHRNLVDPIPSKDEVEQVYQAAGSVMMVGITIVFVYGHLVVLLILRLSAMLLIAQEDGECILDKHQV